MSIYTVHEPPLRAAQAAPDPERFLFVRDGFSVWAVVFSVLWMLRHRMWLVLLIYLIVAVGVEVALRFAGVQSGVMAVVELLIALLVGIEAGNLRRFTLARRGWKNVAVVSGTNLEDAERRFFDVWAREPRTRREEHATPGSPPPVPQPAVRPPQSSGVIGLFPEPEAPR